MNSRSISSKHTTMDQVLPEDFSILVKLGIAEGLYRGKPCNYFASENQWWIGSLDSGLPNGNGIVFIPEPRKLFLVTTMKKGFKDGKCKGYYQDGTNFELIYKRNMYEGNMECYNSKRELLFRGEFLQTPLVRLKYTNGNVYVGQHSYFLKHGKGKLYRDNSQNLESVIHDGVWMMDTFIKGFSKIDFYIGETTELVHDGQGTLFYDKECSLKKFQGRFRKGKYVGEGIEYNQNQSIKYTGYFEDSLYEGTGILYEDNLVYRGSFHLGKLHGRVEIVTSDEIVLKKALYTDGKVEKVQEEFFYDVKLPSSGEITQEEATRGVFNITNIEKVLALHESGTLKYFRYADDNNPVYLGQLNSIEFNESYNGVISEGGTLLYIGELQQVYFNGKGVLRYSTRNEPKKYEGQFLKGYFHGQGDLYYTTGKLLYSGTFKEGAFHGDGSLSIYQIQLPENTISSIEDGILKGSFPLQKYNLKVKGSFVDGKFKYGEYTYTGIELDRPPRVLNILIENPSHNTIKEAKVYENEHLVFEGTVENYTFNGKGTLYYEKSTRVLFKGDFKDGSFHGSGELFDKNGDLVYSGEFISGKYHGNGYLTEALPGIKYIGEFQRGKIHGQGKMLLRDNEDLRSEGYYEEGTLVQGYIKTFENGNLRYEGFIKNGLYHGEGKVYTSTKQIAMEGLFQDGKLKSGFMREFFGDGAVFREGNIQDDLYEGHIKEYFSDGKILFDGYYSKGYKHGEGTLYHRNGKPKQKGTFKEGAFEDGEILLYYDETQVIKIEGQIQGMYLNGFGRKFYETGILEYEGNFSQGQYSGQGKYFNPEGKLRFEGIFSEGYPGGQGVLYDLEGNVIYNGEMNRWKKHGTGIFYSKSGEVLQTGVFADDDIYKGKGKSYWPGFGTLKYEGDYDNGFPEGTGVSFYPNGNLEYRGQFKFGKPHGRGALYSEAEIEKIYFQGEFSKGLFHGEGTLYQDDRIYLGQFRNGKKEGQGTLTSNEDSIGKLYEGRWHEDSFEQGTAWIRYENGGFLYVGTILKGEYDGKGTKYYRDGSVEYEGSWKNGLYHGSGIKLDTNQRTEYEGEYQNGIYNGKGRLYHENGILKYEGEFLRGDYHGKGTLYDEGGLIIYSGHFKENVFHGTGTLYFPESKKIKYSGEFKEGIFHGIGEKYSHSGYRKYHGRFADGKFNGEGILYYPDGKTRKFVGHFNKKIYDKEGALFDEKGAYVYKGGFLDGKYHGIGALYFPGSLETYYEGEFQQGQLEGNGVIKYQDGKIKYKGALKGGKFHGLGELYFENGVLMCEGEFNNGLCSHGLHM